MPPIKKAVPPLPPSRVEQGLAATAESKTSAATDERAAELNAAIAESTASAEELRDQAIDAMVAAGLTRELAEATFELADNGGGAADARYVAEAVAELVAEDHGEPLCPHGCHGPSWAEIPADRDAVGCEHGSFSRRPAEGK